MKAPAVAGAKPHRQRGDGHPQLAAAMKAPAVAGAKRAELETLRAELMAAMKAPAVAGAKLQITFTNVVDQVPQ